MLNKKLQFNAEGPINVTGNSTTILNKIPQNSSVFWLWMKKQTNKKK